LGFAGCQIEYVNLIEGIVRLALALKDHPLSVGRPVAFPGTSALDREAADARQKVAFLVLDAVVGDRCLDAPRIQPPDRAAADVGQTHRRMAGAHSIAAPPYELLMHHVAHG